MRDLLPDLVACWRAGVPVGLATVVDTFDSAPQPPGAAMMVGLDGSVSGSVSGGCVEGAVYELAQQVIGSGTSVLQRYGIADDDAFAVGLTCGGTLDVYVERIDRHSFAALDRVADAVEAGRPVAVATVVSHPDASRVGRRIVVESSPGGAGEKAGATTARTTGSLGAPGLDAVVAADALVLLGHRASQTCCYSSEGSRSGREVRVAVWALAPPPRMLVFGAVDFATALSRAGRGIGYEVIVCDARPVFATPARFPDASDVIVDWPHRYLASERDAGRIDAQTAVVVLTHDPKFDVPLIEVAARLPHIGYLGAMGSRRTHAERVRRLREVGLSDLEIERVHSPIGLDLGARTPEQTAVSIVAEIIASQHGGTGSPLSEMEGPIHRQAEAPSPGAAGRDVPSSLRKGATP